MDQPKRLYRSSGNRMIAGVCAGLAEYFNIDPTLVRVAFVVLSFGGGFGIAAYVILWIVIPEAGQGEKTFEQQSTDAAKEIKMVAEKTADSIRHGDRNNGAAIAGIILVLVGVMALGHTFWPWSFFRWSYFWPLIIIAIGLRFIIKRK